MVHDNKEQNNNNRNKIIVYLAFVALALYLHCCKTGKLTITGVGLSFLFPPIVIIHYLLDGRESPKGGTCGACRL